MDRKVEFRCHRLSVDLWETSNDLWATNRSGTLRIVGTWQMPSAEVILRNCRRTCAGQRRCILRLSGLGEGRSAELVGHLKGRVDL